MADQTIADGAFLASYVLGFSRRRLVVEVTANQRIVTDLHRIAAFSRLYFWAFACVLVVLVWQRCPSIISHATFWAEDGWFWYPQAYAFGWHCLLIDHSGYLQTISRLVALFSLLFPLAFAPKVFAVSALSMQAAPAIFLVSRRMAPAIPSLPARLALALLLVAIPGMSEVYVNLTNSQWHLALLAFLVLVAAPAITLPERAFDTLVLVVSGLSGPFALFLAPCALLWFFLYRKRWHLWRLALIAAAAIVQLMLLIMHQGSRGHGPGIGWSLHRFAGIVVKNIAGVALFGQQTIAHDHGLTGQNWLSRGGVLPATVVALVLLGGCLLLLVGLLRGPWVLRSFLLFAGLEFAASLTDGLAITKPLWVGLQIWIGGRYFFHPIAALLALFMRLVCSRGWMLRTPGVALMALTVIVAVPSDWSLPRHQKATAFRREAEAFAKAPPGTVMRFAIPPAQEMILVKR